MLPKRTYICMYFWLSTAITFVPGKWQVMDFDEDTRYITPSKPTLPPPIPFISAAASPACPGPSSAHLMVTRSRLIRLSGPSAASAAGPPKGHGSPVTKVAATISGPSHSSPRQIQLWSGHRRTDISGTNLFRVGMKRARLGHTAEANRQSLGSVKYTRIKQWSIQSSDTGVGYSVRRLTWRDWARHHRVDK